MSAFGTRRLYLKLFYTFMNSVLFMKDCNEFSQQNMLSYVNSIVPHATIQYFDEISVRFLYQFRKRSHFSGKCHSVV